MALRRVGGRMRTDGVRCAGGPRRDVEGGFSLIETLVALAVLAVGAMALLTGVERYVGNTRGLEDRIVARWVAENVLAAMALDVAVERDWTEALNVTWDSTFEARDLPGSELRMVTVRVADVADRTGGAVVSLTGYLAR